MLQANEIEKRFTSIERSIDQLREAVKVSQDLPQDLQDCVRQLDSQKSAARKVLQSHDEQRIVQCVDDLEQTSDRAGQAVKSATNIDDDVRRAVMEAHRELSELKLQLH